MELYSLSKSLLLPQFLHIYIIFTFIIHIHSPSFTFIPSSVLCNIFNVNAIYSLLLWQILHNQLTSPFLAPLVAPFLASLADLAPLVDLVSLVVEDVSHPFILNLHPFILNLQSIMNITCLAPSCFEQNTDIAIIHNSWSCVCTCVDYSLFLMTPIYYNYSCRPHIFIAWYR